MYCSLWFLFFVSSNFSFFLKRNKKRNTNECRLDVFVLCDFYFCVTLFFTFFKKKIYQRVLADEVLASHLRLRFACHIVISSLILLKILINVNQLVIINQHVNHWSFIHSSHMRMRLHFACHMVINQLLSVNISIDYLTMYLLWNNSSSIKMRLCVKEGSTNLN